LPRKAIKQNKPLLGFRWGEASIHSGGIAGIAATPRAATAKAQIGSSIQGSTSPNPAPGRWLLLSNSGAETPSFLSLERA